jgi:hypothetical protein
MKRTPLPATIRHFVQQQTTLPVADLWKRDARQDRSPYGSYWQRAIACMLLSGRVKAKMNGGPNMIDVNRIGKEANFNQYLFERTAKLFTAMKVVTFDRQDRYHEGPNLDAFWNHDADPLKKAVRRAFIKLFRGLTGLDRSPSSLADLGHLFDLLALFFACFKGRALVDTTIGQVFLDFSQLPKGALIEVAKGLGQKASAVDPESWKSSLNLLGQKALVIALYELEWAYNIEREKTGWIFASPTGLGMLGLDVMPPAPELSDVFKVLPNLSVFAGAGLGRDKLVPLFRHGVIKRIDQVFEFQLDRRRLAQSAAPASPGEELRNALRELEPLPSTIASLLDTKSSSGGEIAIRACSALVRPQNAEVLEAIRRHPRLKGYLESGAPTGYLLIKNSSDARNFVRRCHELGFQIKPL